MTMRLLLRLLCSWADLARSIALMVIGLILVPHFSPAGSTSERKGELRATTSQHHGRKSICPTKTTEVEFQARFVFRMQILLRLRKSQIPETRDVQNWKLGHHQLAPSLSLQLKLSGHRSLRRWMTEHTDALPRRRIARSSHVVAVDR